MVSNRKIRKVTRVFRWKLVDFAGKVLSRHFTKKQAEFAQLRSNKSRVYVRKI